MTVLAPQCYGLDRAGALHGQLPAGVLEVTRRAGLPLMPLVTNPGFDRATAHALLHNAKAQERAANHLAQLAERDQYVGWQLDFEEHRPRGQACLHAIRGARGGAPASRPSPAERGGGAALFRHFSGHFAPGFHTGEWGAAFDFRGLGRVADFLVLMAYDQHTPSTPPGPVAGYDWVQAALDYAVRRVPPAKLLLGIPFYGREWVETRSGATAHSLALQGSEALP